MMKTKWYLILGLFLCGACSEEVGIGGTGDEGSGNAEALPLQVKSVDNAFVEADSAIAFYLFREGVPVNNFAVVNGGSYDLQKGDYSGFAFLNFGLVTIEPGKSEVAVTGNDYMEELAYTPVAFQHNAKDTLALQFRRLVGMLSIRVLNWDDFPEMSSFEFHITNLAQTLIVGESVKLEGRREGSVHIYGNDVQYDNYLFPTNGVLTGEFVFWPSQVSIPFTAKHAVEANKKLEIDVTFNFNAVTKSAPEAGIVCEERVTDL